MEEPKKMDLRSMNITEEHKTKLKQIFPHVFNEEKIDFERLKQTLGEDIDTGLERFGLTWPGKAECMKIIQQPSIGTLKPCKEESVNFDTTENLFIEGDNLEVLKLLQKSYYGKVKMIYIDPPYNTGKEFIYPDKYSETLETYLAYTGQVDVEGKKFSTNTESEGRFHSKWLNMMYLRFFLARNLLRDDGVIFVSIDDNEIHHLRIILNEIFGEENFLGMISRATGTRMGSSGNRGIARELDYILVFAKTESCKLVKLEMTEEELAIYDMEDDKGKYLIRSLRRTGGENRREDRPNMYYPVLSPDGDEIFPIAPEGWESRWICSKETYENQLKEGNIVWKKVLKNGEQKWQVYQKHYLDDEGREPSDLWSKDEGNKKATRDLNAIFDNKKLFDHPKPVTLIQKILQLGTNKKEDSIVLDFFAGSATTAHAVLAQNQEDGGKRKFIMIQIPEHTDSTDEAYRAGYKTIADIGKERIRRVIKKIQDESKGQLDFQNTKIDLGFKIFKLDQSSFKIWDGVIEQGTDGKRIEKQLEMQIEHIDPKATQEDVLYELLLKSGFSLTTKVESLELAGTKVYSIENGVLMICLDKALTKEVIAEMARKEPSRVICLDAGFSGNDQLKTNAVQIMKSHNVEDFRTV